MERKMIVEYEQCENKLGNPEKINFENKYNIPEIQIDFIKAKRQCKLEIQGVEVYFPYTPYENQLNYMSKGKFII